MVRVGNIELQGELTMVKLAGIVEDVPVNKGHVAALTVSLKNKGQLSPLLLHKESNRWIDGSTAFTEQAGCVFSDGKKLFALFTAVVRKIFGVSEFQVQ